MALRNHNECCQKKEDISFICLTLVNIVIVIELVERLPTLTDVSCFFPHAHPHTIRLSVSNDMASVKGVELDSTVGVLIKGFDFLFCQTKSRNETEDYTIS